MLVSPNGEPAVIDDTLAAAVPVLVIVTVCAALVDPTAWLAKDTEVGEADSVAVAGGVVPPPPEPGKISNSEICAAVQPELAEKSSSRYWSFVPDGRLNVTVFPVAGLKV